MNEVPEAAAPIVAPADRRCGFVAIVGAPNVGKSTLVNALVGAKVTIVSPKVQTTRTIMRGIAIEGDAQLIFVDTPGIFSPRRRLDRAMVATAWSGAHDADVVALMIDAKRGLDDEATAIAAKLADVPAPKILIVNKVDLVAKPSLLGLVAAANEKAQYAATFMVAALSGYGVPEVKRWLAARMPEGPWHYPEDQISDAPLRALASEITREKIYLRLHQELPYHSTVETEVLAGTQGRLGADRADDLCGARKPAQDRARQGRADHQGDRRARAPGDRRDHREAGAPLPVREGARKLERRPRALPGDGLGVSQGLSAVFAGADCDIAG